MSVHSLLEDLWSSTDAEARIADDPVAWPRRYSALRDVEIASFWASTLAYGRVDLFRRTLSALFAVFDARGGPAAFVESFDPTVDGSLLWGIHYRFHTHADLVVLIHMLKRIYRRADSLEDLLLVGLAQERTLAAGLNALIEALRVEAMSAAGVASYEHLSRGVRYSLPRPADGSACKRWCLAVRWLVRPTHEGVDLHRWRRVSTSLLVIPVDTHVLRLSQFLGLTRRSTASWRTALEITASLARFDGSDPVRFDFALAHHGISGACLGYRAEPVCRACVLQRACAAPAGAG